MARTTPRVEQEVLVLPESQKASVPVGSQQWYSWLADEKNGSFFFRNEVGSFTARKERRKRGGWYWIAYRSRGGKLAKTYIGRSEDLTLERLREVTSLLVEHSVTQQQAALRRLRQPLITPVFLPPLPAMRAERMIERTTLLERLDQSLGVKLTLITAPAGFGKTMLLSRWYERVRQQRGDELALAWITLDERDNDPARFWNAVWSALCGGREGGTELDIAGTLASTPRMPLETVLVALVNALRKRPASILILDDYHVITHPQIHEGMNMLLTHLPAHLHLMLAGRSEPPLALGRARVYGELVELRAGDLRLTQDEVRRFLHHSAGVELSAEDQAILEQRIDGWIAGLHLASLAIRGQPSPGEILAHFTGSQRSLFDYFAEEVFAQQPAAIQQFLLSTALLTELTPALCAAMSDSPDHQQARHLLDSIERANLFLVPLDEQRQRYRYHALFREFLCEKARRSQPDLISHLYRRAADFFEQQGMREEALEYALAAQDAGRARQLLEQMGEEWLWKKGEARRLLTWLEKLPDHARAEHPQLEILYVWALLLSGHRDLEEVETRLCAIEQRQAEAVSEALRGDIAALRARLAAFHNDVPQVITFSRQALQVLSKERALLRADVVFGLSGTSRNLDESYRLLAEAQHLSQVLGSWRTALFASRYLAATCVDQGKLTEAEAILQQALHLVGDSEQARVPVAGFVHIGLGELCYERNELAAARNHALLGIELGERCGELKSLLYGYCLLALICAAQGEIEQGWQQVWQAEKIALMGKVSWLRESISAIAVHLALLQGDLDKAKWALGKQGINAEQGIAHAPGAEQAVERLMLARVWLAEQKESAVLQLLGQVEADARQRKHLRHVFAARTLQASALFGLRKHQQAVRLLNETLTLAGSEGYLRTFLDLGEPVQKLLQRTEKAGSAKAYAHRLLAASGQSLNSPESHGGLSEREYEVLQQVAAGMSNQEIADTLIVAVSTIKVHVRHLCQKLDAQNRIQMVARAREQGLL